MKYLFQDFNLSRKPVTLDTVTFDYFPEENNSSVFELSVLYINAGTCQNYA